VAGRLLNAGVGVGLMVVPEHRSGPSRRSWWKKAFNQTLENRPDAARREAALRVFKGVGWAASRRHPSVRQGPECAKVCENLRARESSSSVRALVVVEEGPCAHLDPGAAFVSVGFAGLAILGTVRRWRVPRAAVGRRERRVRSSYTLG